jgi:RimJ/RimL family protein N-acetyltransferase
LKPTLATERLVLRPFRAEDARNLCELDADPDVRRFVDQPDPPTLAHCESVVSRIRGMDEATPELGFWIAEERGVFVGWFHLKPPREGEPAEPGDLEIGYRLMRVAWGRGLATEGSRTLVARALGTLHAPRVTAVALEENAASIRVIEKLGMREWRRWEYRSRSGAMLPIVTYARSH